MKKIKCFKESPHKAGENGRVLMSRMFAPATVCWTVGQFPGQKVDGGEAVNPNVPFHFFLALEFNRQVRNQVRRVETTMHLLFMQQVSMNHCFLGNI